MRHIQNLLSFVIVCWACGVANAAEALPKSAVPDPLKSWIPWVLHGHEMLACPQAHNGDGERACVWPSRLELNATRTGATFRLEVQVFGTPALVALPGEPGKWPQALKANGQPLAASNREERPVALLAPGSHVVTGALPWTEMPEDVLLPRETGTLQLRMDGKVVLRAPDEEGRLWLQAATEQAPTSDALTVRTSRLLDDSIPLRVTTHYDLAVSGKPREIQLPMTLLPGFAAESLNSALPARLAEDGQLRLQVRPGNWTVEVTGRRMAPTSMLPLPQGLADEIWSFVAHNELRVVSVEGLGTVDPKQVPIPEQWRSYPAFQIKGGQALKLVESRRGNPNPAADKLALARQIWLDFDGKGYTMQDAFQGTLSRTWRLEMAPPAVLGHVASDADDQAVTRRAGAQGDGVELRRGVITSLKADSRLEGDSRTLPATGWTVDVNAASAQLNLPPGWHLLHASGVDRAEGSWLDRWTLWDFFIVLLSTLAAAKLIGPKAGALMALALMASAHMEWAPRESWLVLLALLALTRVLPAGKLHTWATWGSRACALLIAMLLLPHAIEQIRLSIHPSLKLAAGSMGEGGMAPPNAPPAPAPAMAPQPEALARTKQATIGERMGSLSSKVEAHSPDLNRPVNPYALGDVDPNAKVQTGPGLPTWHWTTHHLSWQGPVQTAQNMQLYLMPPAATVVLRLGGLALLLAVFWFAASALPPWRKQDSQDLRSTVPTNALSVLLVAVVGTLLATVATDGHATAPPAQTTTASPGGSLPDAAVLQELRNKITAAPACLPHCADIARLRVEARGAQVQLRLEVHALADTMLPLPGQGSNWCPTVITTDGKPAVVRRDDSGALWLAVRTGVSTVVLAADVGDASAVEIALPMPAREVTAQAEGWTLNGLDARGLSSGALSLSRTVVGNNTSSKEGTQRDGLPSFVQVQRTMRLGLRWTMNTQITRLTPSRAPIRVKIRLLAGESVNNETVRVEDGYALVQLGAEDSASFASSLKEATRLQLTSSQETNQIERWWLDPSTQWHVQWNGIAPVQYVAPDSQRLLPTWQPWPGESITLDISKPVGSAGQTLTIDNQKISMTPGIHATDVAATATLRTSQGGNHRVQLPVGIEFLGLSVDGVNLPIQPQGRDLSIPLTPGAHALKIDWREPRGIDWGFASTPQALGASGVNASTEIHLGPERVVLAIGGPRMGPAVLFWGVVLALLGVAVALGRTRLTPLGIGAWFLLGVGLAQTSLWGAAVVVGFFFALAARRVPNGGLGRKTFNLLQIVLVLWALVSTVIVFGTIQTGLLGYPDMMVTGNGSTASSLHWYQDRFTGQPDATWVLSMPVLAYRLLMLFWALWLAASIVRWTKWAWECFSLGGYWRKREPVVQQAEDAQAHHPADNTPAA